MLIPQIVFCSNLPSTTPGLPVESSSASNKNQIPKLPERQPLDPNFDAAYSNKIAMNVFDLSQKLVQNVLKKNEVGKNYEILSPISIASALQLALLGAKGKTFIELMRVLGHSYGSMSGIDAATVHEQFGKFKL